MVSSGAVFVSASLNVLYLSQVLQMPFCNRASAVLLTNGIACSQGQVVRGRISSSVFNEGISKQIGFVLLLGTSCGW